jgi:hypothetical protein
MRERQDVNRTREAGHLDEIQCVVASMLKLSRNGAVGFIVWLGLAMEQRGNVEPEDYLPNKDHDSHYRMRANAP